MNPLQTNPELFVGNFKVAIKGYTNLKIEQYDSVKNQFWVSDISNAIKVSDCTLIARPIEDMTGEEIDQFLFPAHRGDGNYTEIKQDLVRMANEGTLAFGQAKKMLKRGVYPGPQEDFGDTVIDTRTLTNA